MAWRNGLEDQAVHQEGTKSCTTHGKARQVLRYGRAVKTAFELFSVCLVKQSSGACTQVTVRLLLYAMPTLPFWLDWTTYNQRPLKDFHHGLFAVTKKSFESGLI